MRNIFSRRERTGNPDIDGRDYEWAGGVYLTTVSNTLQAEILISKLRGEGISSACKEIGSTGYMEVLFGSTTSGEFEIYVPEECYEDAKNIIVPIDLDSCEPVEFEENN